MQIEFMASVSVITPDPAASQRLYIDDAVTRGSEELRAAGYELLHAARLEPWGQTVVRLLSPEHAVVGLSYAPWVHDEPTRD